MDSRIMLGLVAAFLAGLAMVVSLLVVAPAATAAAGSEPVATEVAGPGYWRHYRREARRLRDRRLAACRTQRCRDRAWDAYRKAMLFSSPLPPIYGGGPHLPDLTPIPGA